ncbi:MAG TPA: alpha-1,2-fucosyltransferase, partial [Chitinophagaceae bacterium]|nr:alpha-1,2-fucosyltransferase [Chitinophagaceae bacterium]
YLDEIRSVNAVSIHVRRGDYVNDKETNAVHGVCSIDYYREAINRLSGEISEPRFYIFSDDMDWARANLPISPHLAVYVDNNQMASHEDLRLMSSCKHHIIANSSFSWWGAWLSDYAGKKVIAPRNWFRTLENKDIIPNGWITL